MYQDRVSMYSELEKEFNSKVLVYVTGDRQNLGSQIAYDAIDFFVNHLDKIGPCPSISLYLYTRGGHTAAAWNIVNLLRMYCDKLNVIIPHKAHSAGTIITLGADQIIMTKQATLGPIDPSIKTALNPPIPHSLDTFPVSVEAVNGFIDLARNALKAEKPSDLSDAFLSLTKSVHPLVLGEVYRSRAQIKMLAKKLLVNQVTDENDIDHIIDFLCSESGSHDYTINRREAKDDLKLKVVKPSEDQYRIIKQIYDDISEELQLTTTFTPASINGAFAARRSLLESVEGGSDYYITEGTVKHEIMPSGEERIVVQQSFDGWRHEKKISGIAAISYTDEGRALEYESVDEFQV